MTYRNTFFISNNYNNINSWSKNCRFLNINKMNKVYEQFWCVFGKFINTSWIKSLSFSFIGFLCENWKVVCLAYCNFAWQVIITKMSVPDTKANYIIILFYLLFTLHFSICLLFYNLFFAYEITKKKILNI